MHALSSFSIPVLKKWQDSGSGQSDSNATSSEHVPRIYSDDPLPVRPSDQVISSKARSSEARPARIVGRVVEAGSVTYQIQFINDNDGGSDNDNKHLREVGLSGILDYVSPCDLEIYENAQFEEERVLLSIAQAEADAEDERRRERQRERAKLKGAVLLSESGSGGDERSSRSSHSPPPPVVVTAPPAKVVVDEGRYGRARPTYKHMFKVRKERRRRKRNPDTGELMPLSDDGAASEPDALEGEASVDVTSNALNEGSTQHRRGLDIETPPSDDVQLPKRRRRRRHPVTKELMPLGWRYDPEADEQAYKPSAAGRDEDTIVTQAGLPYKEESHTSHDDNDVPTVTDLSIDERAVKRPRLATYSIHSSPGASSSSDIPLGIPQTAEPVARNPASLPAPASKPTANTPGLSTFRRRTSPKHVALDGAADEAPSNPAPHRTTLTIASPRPPSQYQARTILSPRASAFQNPSRPPATQTSYTLATFLAAAAAQDSDSDSPSPLSTAIPANPTTHNPFINAPVPRPVIPVILDHRVRHDFDRESGPDDADGANDVLYCVRWPDRSQPSWEAFENFPDPSVVWAYRERMRLD